MGVDISGMPVLRFGVFELDPKTGELRKAGTLIKLPPQPFKILALLASHPGQLVTREEIQQQVWGSETFVDFEQGLNFAIKKIRAVLGDDADTPRYIETLPRRGYRFITPVERTDHAAQPASLPASLGSLTTPARDVRKQPVESPVEAVAEAMPEGRRSKTFWRRTAALIALGGVIGVAWLARRRAPPLPEVEWRRLTANLPDNAVNEAALSPDGMYLAYSDSAGIHLKLVATGEVQTVPVPGGPLAFPATWTPAAWFPDGAKLLANVSQAGRPSNMWAISVLGGSSREVRENAQAQSVSPDGSWIAFTTGAGSRGNREIWLLETRSGESKRLATASEGEGFGRVTWSPDGLRVAYLRFYQVADQPECTIESLAVKEGKPALVMSDPQLCRVPGGFVWLPGGRILFSLPEPAPNQNDSNLWEVKTDAGNGEPRGQPRKITNSAGFFFSGLSATADGKRLAFLRTSFQSNVYIAELEANPPRTKPPWRLSLDENNDEPTAWTADSRAVLFASDRNGNWDIFKQMINQPSAEPIVVGPEAETIPRLSPDGSWVLYIAAPTPGQETSLRPVRLMRVPIDGGPSYPVLTTRGYNDHRCARYPATLCLLAEHTPDNRQLVFTSFDPIRGRGRELNRINKERGGQYNWDLSPDGSTVAITKFDPHEGRIRFLTLSSGRWREVIVQGWTGLNSMDWSADGKSLFVSSQSSGGVALLHIDVQGSAQVLRKQKNSVGPQTWGVPSPDGRYLALSNLEVRSNVWMIEKF